jgi:hypothetical protein
MKKLSLVTALLLASTAPGLAGAETIAASLTGYEEVPSVSTPASGEFKAMVGRNDQSIDYELTYSGLVGTVQQAHIHFAQPGVNGSIVLWLCETATTQHPVVALRDVTPECPQSGTVTGHLTADNVVTAGTASQQILAGELAEVIAAIRAGFAYVNVHATPLNPVGEIRGQVRGSNKP